jgi:hypothetical protein
MIVDEDGRCYPQCTSSGDARYSKEELELIDTRCFGATSNSGRAFSQPCESAGGQLLNEEVLYRSKQGEFVHVLMSYVQVAYLGGMSALPWQAACLGL